MLLIIHLMSELLSRACVPPSCGLIRETIQRNKRSPMADTPYLVALALIETSEGRALPIAGRSQKMPASKGEAPQELGHALALELLLRVWQRSDEGFLRRAAGVDSLLLVELPMERLPEDLPQLKANWLNSGDAEAFKEALRAISERCWFIEVKKLKPVTLQPAW